MSPNFIEDRVCVSVFHSTYSVGIIFEMIRTKKCLFYIILKCETLMLTFISEYIGHRTSLCMTSEYLDTKETEHTLFLLFPRVAFGSHGMLNLC